MELKDIELLEHPNVLRRGQSAAKIYINILYGNINKVQRLSRERVH